MSQIEVSVVIPTYNRRQILKEMLESLCLQAMPADRFEVIVVVDGSTDGTWEMLQEIETPYELTSLYQENAGLGSSVFSSGVSVARNKGVSVAQGSVVLFLDDDLAPMPELVEEHAQIHRSDPKAVVLGRLLPVEGSKGKRGWNLWEERALQTHYRLMASGERPAAGWRLYSANFSVRREQFTALNGFDLEMGHVRGEDVELGFRLEEDGATYYYAEAGAAIHRGFRTFTSWCNSAYILGVRDIALAEEKDRPDLLRQVNARYRHQPYAVTLAVKAATIGTGVRKAMVYGLRLGAGALSATGMRSAAHAVYSTIFRLQYWCGVTDRLGGRRGFARFVYEAGSPVTSTGADRPAHATAPSRPQR